MKEVYAYVRVSTVRQGEKGSSLGEQRDAITAYAARHGLHIIAWFEEMQTAAKVGRREFSRMLRLLERRTVSGVVLHKIDRGARNLKDWANLRDLTDRGIDVLFAHESLDLTSRSGALAADLQAVIAADYIRNLRDEVKKGIYGRLKQGLYPLPAPLGYLNRGGGNPKVPDPDRALLIRKAFELYSTGAYSLHVLSDTLYGLGLRSTAGGRVTANRLSEILHDSFYVGLIRIKRNGQTFSGVHEPIVSVSLFEQVQAVLSGKAQGRTATHAFVFRRMIRCGTCRYALIGERQKGHVYYRCHTRSCHSVCLRENRVEEALESTFAKVVLTPEETAGLRELAHTDETIWQKTQEDMMRATRLSLDGVEARLSRLLDAYLTSAVEAPLFEEKKQSLLMERKALEERLREFEQKADSAAQVLPYLELAESLLLSYETAIPEEKRVLVHKATSNLTVKGKNVVVALRSPFQEIANRERVLYGAPCRDTPRTDMSRLRQLLAVITAHVTAERKRVHEE